MKELESEGGEVTGSRGGSVGGERGSDEDAVMVDAGGLGGKKKRKGKK